MSGGMPVVDHAILLGAVDHAIPPGGSVTTQQDGVVDEDGVVDDRGARSGKAEGSDA